jgi:hypothetical protein
VAYAAGGDGKQLVVLDATEGKHYDEIMKRTPIFSTDSNRLAYVATQSAGLFRRREKQCVVLNGQELTKYDGIGFGSLSFSPDSKRVAYWALRGRDWLPVVDGIEGTAYDQFVSAFRLVSDSPQLPSDLAGQVLLKEYYSLVWTNANSLHGLAVRQGEILRVEMALVEQ